MALKIKFRLKGFDELRTAPGVEADVERRAQAIAAAAGDGIEVLPAQSGRKRARRVIGPTTPEGAIRNNRDNVIINNLDVGA